ncbi:MAG: ubiquinol oxidase subunit II [Candidatus Saccharibacteria bacterium]|nr:ubiquinol oxidase subunit II [Candidatus Saccharibacteria bacterium]
MKRKYELLISIVLSLVVILAALLYFSGANIAVLNPQGVIADKQRDLIIVSVLLMLIVVVPVYAMLFTFGWKYRASNKKATYKPNADSSIIAETVWWVVPIIIIAALSGIIWTSSHELDPAKSLSSKNKTITIQVVALQWKWLFIYPEQNIATVNYVQFPQKTPVKFEITSDAPMNSFWIPSLGSQIYAMSGMSTSLNLMANSTGSYRGSSANISGDGFAGMKFTARSTTDSDFEDWSHRVKNTGQSLDYSAYERLAKPSKNNPVAYYSLNDSKLYDKVILKYVAPPNHTEGSNH